MRSVEIVENDQGHWVTRPDHASAEYLEDLVFLGIRDEFTGLIVDRINGDPCILTANPGEADRFSLMFGLFETGQVDCERFDRVFLLPNGETVEV